MQVPSNAQRGRVKEKAKKVCGRASTLPTPYPIEYSRYSTPHRSSADGWMAYVWYPAVHGRCDKKNPKETIAA